jgi:transposase
VDVGKAVAVALVADHYGEVLVAPFEFALTEAGFAVLSVAITRARHERDAVVVRIGVEAAGHYHRTLVARLQAAGWRSSNSTREQ